MSQFEELVQQQLLAGGEVQKLIANFKKDPISRKTRKYFEERLNRLDEVSKRFEANNCQIQRLETVPRQHDYFAKDYFVEIMALINHYRKLFLTELSSDDKDGNMEESEAFEKADQGGRQTTIPQSGLAVKLPNVAGFVRKQHALMSSMLRILSSNVEENQPRQYYERKMKAIEHLWNQIEANNYSIWEYVEDPEAAGYNQNNYIELEKKVQDLLVMISVKTESQSTEANRQNEDVQLPKITIPKFDGDYLKWPQFFDLFSEMIHKKPLDNIQKMWYLKTNLTGEAERLIRHLSLTKDNYVTAWEILKDRYHNIRMLTSSLIQKLLDQPTSNSESTNAATIKALHDTTRESLLALNALKVSTDSWGPLLLHTLIKKLDRSTRVLYEQSLKNPRELQTMNDFLKFLELRFQSLEAITQKTKQSASIKTCTTATSSSYKGKGTTCNFCQEGMHPLHVCQKFLQLNAIDRKQHVQKKNLCFNCLKPGHGVNLCSSRSCSRCNKRHHTLLHMTASASDQTTSGSYNKPKQNLAARTESQEEPGSTNLRSTLTASMKKSAAGYILLGTARVKIMSNNGEMVECRALLDSGSQINVITEKLVKKLGLPSKSTSLTIEGIGKEKRKSHHRVMLNIQSRISQFTAPVEAFVLPKIISPQPSKELNIATWPLPRNIQLADPNFYRPEQIDLLLGAELYPRILSDGQIHLTEHLPILQNTMFGWVATGKVNMDPEGNAFCGVGINDDDSIDNLLTRFWEIEENYQDTTTLSEAEKQCETHFVQHTQRSSEGRFIVKLPFINEPTSLGQSLTQATNRFLNLERRLDNNPDVKRQYIDFMDEYERLGHMKEIDRADISSPHYFIPHHMVLRPESSTTKLRVVFDASAKTTSGLSLNDILHKGPTVQSELFSILLRFRLPRFAFTTDVEKMYRQILIHPDDEMMQLIVWRKNSTHSLKYYGLKTVTYGTRPAPYLATKCLQQLAKDKKARFPLGAAALEQDFYVDDALTGSNSLVEALEIQHELTSLLQEAGFKLRKWCANHPQLLQGIPEKDLEVNLELASDNNKTIKTLGLIWMPHTDNLLVKINRETTTHISKRTVASDLARIYDPLGLLAPVVVAAKIFIQKLWQLKLDWDDVLPEQYQQEWKRFRKDLESINNLIIPRHVFSHKIPCSTQLHCFTDASEKAYGAAVFIRAVFKDNSIAVRLLCAKSRIAPLKKQTIPRLELCAALLGAQLMSRVKMDLKYEDQRSHFWTDSQVVLSWINSCSTSYQTFVAHRVAKIQELTLAEQWRYVDTKQNPADVLSRGLRPKEMHTCNLWFYGPIFLHGKELNWPTSIQKHRLIQDPPEKKKSQMQPIVATSNVMSEDILYNINSRNSFSTLRRIVAYILRFIKNAKGASNSRCTGIVLSSQELDDSLHYILRTIQRSDFKAEINQLLRSGQVEEASSVASLKPFIDDNGIIRVGGRLQSSSLPYDAKHPILLPYNDPIVKLIMEDVHQKNLHCGPQMLLAQTRQRFWPIKGKLMARSIVQHCVRCTRAKPVTFQQVMGNLPPTRVQPARPFVNAGVDFCGPFWVHYKVRGKRPQKAYICVYCCFSTKAVHLEVVSDLTTDAFIGSIKRFIARRGHCKNMYCDNATNFVGARNQLAELETAIQSKSAQEKIIRTCSDKGISFTFIPPRAPHFGGLWEAAVKSAKYLLTRSVSTASLTYEELETVIIEIEAILNSRPITPMSSDPNDLSALTPGHFLIGEPLTAQIDEAAKSATPNLLSRWKLVSYIKNEFWKRWHIEYLNELQQRYKWKTRAPNAKEGTLVIIKEDNVPTLRWPLGRIVKVYPGQDGAIRVADVKTATGTLKRPIHRLAPLFPEDNTSKLYADDWGQKDKEEPLLPNQNHSRPKDIKHQHVAKRPRLTAGSMVMTLLCICLAIVPPSVQSVEIKSFDHNPGIYFEKLGSAGIITSEWNLVTYFDMQPYWKHFENIKRYPNIIRQLCEKRTHTNTCSRIGSQLESNIQDLEINNKFLTPADNKRSKRAAFNFVGNVAHYLFGVLDSEYADKLSGTIDKLRENNNQLASTLHNQTSFIDSTLNIMKEDQQEIEGEFQAVENAINRTTTWLSKLEVSEQVSEKLTEITFQASMALIKYQRIQNSLLDIVMDSQHGRINPILLPPGQLQVELFKLQTILPKTVTLPIATENLLKFYNLMTIQSRVTEKYIIFTVKIPLIAADQFELLNLIPIPWKKENNSVVLVTSSTHLIVDLHREQYYPLNKDELRQCITTNEDRFLCRHHHPLYRQGSGQSSCEISLLSHTTTPSCTTKPVSPAPQWIQLHEPNAWIYTLDRETPLNVVCNNILSRMTLQGSGVLTIEGNCIIKQPLITIQGHSLIGTKRHTSYIPEDDIESFLNTSQKTISPELEHKHQFHLQHEQLSMLKEQVLKLQTNIPTNMYEHNIHHYTVGYISLCLSIIIAVAIIWSIKRCYQQHHTTGPRTIPVPLPRKTATSSPFTVAVH